MKNGQKLDIICDFLERVCESSKDYIELMNNVIFLRTVVQYDTDTDYKDLEKIVNKYRR